MCDTFTLQVVSKLKLGLILYTYMQFFIWLVTWEEQNRYHHAQHEQLYIIADA